MNRHPSQDDVLSALGDKVVDAFAESVSKTREDLAAYRSGFPGWVAEHSERGLASWIHDRLWANLVGLLHDVPDVFLYSSEPTREVLVNDRLRMRVKRHDVAGSVAAYPTQGAFEFFAQPKVAAFDGMDQVHLIAGYCWTKDLRGIGEAVLSLRDGKDNVIWLVDLDSRAAGTGSQSITSPAPINPEVDGPTPPTIDLAGIEEDAQEVTS